MRLVSIIIFSQISKLRHRFRRESIILKSKNSNRDYLIYEFDVLKTLKLLIVFKQEKSY